VVTALRRDADFTPAGAAPAPGPLAALLAAEGTTLLVPPPGPDSYDDVRATLTRRHFGAPTAPFHVLAEKPDGEDLGSDWAPAPPAVAALLDRRVTALARENARRGNDFNGPMARLAGWRVEQSGTSPHRRLHLLVERTNFLSSKATSAGLALPGALPRELLEAGSLRRHLHAPDRSWTANALAVHLVVITSDRRLVLAQRSLTVQLGAGQLNTAVNGVTELHQPTSPRRGDHDEDGFVDLVATALREADEELGTHLGLARADVVVRALALNDRPDQVVPYVIMEARAKPTFVELAKGHFAHVCRHEGAIEVGEHLLGVPLDDPAVALDVTRWLHHLWNADPQQITASGLATTLLTFARLAGEEQVVNAWNAPPLTAMPPAVERHAV
jgi:hypothetical protein